MAGRTMRFGTIRCSRSMAEITTSTALKNAASSAYHVRPNANTHAAISSAVVSSTAG